jgi:hypothetical protein
MLLEMKRVTSVDMDWTARITISGRGSHDVQKRAGISLLSSDYWAPAGHSFKR